MIQDSNFRALISHQANLLNGKRAVLGFDGFVDTVARAIRLKSDVTQYFDTMAEFGRYAQEKSGMNFSLELEERMVKLGGNMPIMAQAMANMGTNIVAMGSMGYPELHRVFRPMAAYIELASFADPGLSTAIEFNDGKMLLAQMGALNHVDWSIVKERIGLEAIRRIFAGADLYAILNWSELDHATSIWKGILSDVLKGKNFAQKPIGFFDLSDCSRREPKAIQEALSLLKEFKQYWNVTLSLNQNEARVVYAALTGKDGREIPLEKVGLALYQELDATIIIHYSKQALAWSSSGFVSATSETLHTPMLSTGAGDNFNAGICTGMLMGLSTGECLTLGHAVARHYMTTGISPTISNLLGKP